MDSTSTSFPKTRWTLIQRVRSGSAQERANALEDLCKAYWFPLYAFARKTGRSQPEAEDAVQDFMCSILDSDLFASAEQSRGHLRTLLLTSFAREIKNRQTHDSRQKRGGDITHIPLTFSDSEDRYQLEIQSLDLPPDVLFHRQWAQNLIQRALIRLKQLFADQGQPERLKALRAFLPLNDGINQADMDAAAFALGLSSGAFRIALHRTRQYYRKFILDEISQTIDSDDPALIEEEMRALLQVLSR